MSDHSLPTHESDHDDSDHDTDASSIFEDDGDITYVIRLTPDEKYSRDDVASWLREKFPMEAWVIGTELVPRLHFHVVLKTRSEDIKPAVREFLFKYWPVRGRGWGNKQYNCTFSTDPDAAVSYAIKEGDYIFEVFDPEYIEERLAASFKKHPPSSFTVEFRELNTSFQESAMDIREYMIKFAQLKAKYNQMVNITHAYSYAMSALFRRNPQEAEHFVENYLYKQ